MKKIFLILVAVVLAGSMLLSACGEEEEPVVEPEKPVVEPEKPVVVPVKPAVEEPSLGPLAKPAGGKEGGRLQLVGMGNIANLGDPNTISNPGDAGYAFPCIEPLVTIGSDGNLKPWLAERFEIAEDGSHIMLYLRKGVKFHDGSDFNAEACKYNLDNGIYSKVWPNMNTCESCEIIDDYTVKLNFKDGKFDWGATKSLAGFFSVRMFSPTSLEENDNDWKRTHVVGTGPFKLMEFKRDQVLKYDRFDDYWRGKPYLDGIDYNIIPDTMTALLAYKSGEVHVAIVQPSDAQDLLDSGFALRETTDMAGVLCLIPSSNNPDSPLADVNVRRAVEHAIDKQALVDGLTYGYGHAADQEFVFPPYMDPDTVGYPYDLEKARQLLADAGYSEGFTTSIWLADFLPLDLMLAIQDQLSRVNITVDIERISIVQINEMVGLGGGGWEGYFYSFGFCGMAVDPSSSLINGPFNNNTTWISCHQPDDLQELAKQAAGEIDQDARAAMYQEISRRMTDDYCMWTFLYYTTGLTSISPLLKGYTIGEYTEPFPYTFAWLEE